MDDHGRVSAHTGDGDRRHTGGHCRRNRHDDTGEGDVKQNGGLGQWSSRDHSCVFFMHGGLG